MSSEFDIGSMSDSSICLDRALENGIWDGRKVSRMDAAEFLAETNRRILALLFKNPDNQTFEQLSAHLACMQSREGNRSLLSQEIQKLNFSKGDRTKDLAKQGGALSPKRKSFAANPTPFSNPVQAIALSKQSWIADFLQTIGRGLIDPDLMDPNVPLPSAKTSCRFRTTGVRDPRLGIGGINGMNTSFEQAQSHANYLAQFF